MLGIKVVKLQETGENCVLRSVRICFAVQIFWWSDQGDWEETFVWNLVRKPEQRRRL